MPLPRYLRTRLILGALLAVVIWLVTLAHAATVQLTWDAPTWPPGQTPIALLSYVLTRNGTEIARPLAPPYSDVVEPGTYTYAVRALYAGNQLSDPSNAVTATVAAPPPVPVPTNFACVFAPGTIPTFTCQAAVVSGPPAGPYPLRPVGALTAQADSQETVAEPGQATLAVDGISTTLWHTEWSQRSPVLPHTLTLDLGAVFWVDGLRYLPRQDAQELNGTITSYRLEASTDLVTWAPVTASTWALDSTEKAVRFPVIKARYVRLVALVSNGTPYASAAEVGIFAVPVL